MPDVSASLQDGVAVRAHVRARLLGIKLLRLDADVVLVPATTLVRDRAAPAPQRALAPAPAAVASGNGRCLSDARRLLVESQDVLDRVALDPALPRLRT